MKKLLTIVIVLGLFVGLGGISVVSAQEPEEGGVEPAAFGAWTTDAIVVQNISGAAIDSAVLELYGDAGLAQSIDLVAEAGGTFGATGNVWVFPASITTDGRYAGLVSASGTVAAAVHNYNATGKSADFYYGENNPAQVMWCPLVFGANYSGGWYSQIHAQNASGSTQDINVDVYIAGTTTPAAQVTASSVVDNASTTFDLSDATDFSAFASQYGFARVSGASGNIAVVADNLRQRTDAGEQMQNSYSCVPDASAGQDLRAPLVFKTYSGGWNSGINILNLPGGTSTTVTAQYTPSSACTGCTAGTDTITVDPGAVETLYLPGRTAPHDAWFGSVQLTSTSNILAVANTTKYAADLSVGYSIQAANPTNATTRVAVPMVYNSAGTSNAWIAGIQVSNLGAATDVTVDYVRAPSCAVGSATYTWTQSAGANGSVTFYTPSHPSSVPSGWYGSAYVSSADNRDLLVSVSITGYGVESSGTMAGINYTP
jgi:hypothetical protein